MSTSHIMMQTKGDLTGLMQQSASSSPRFLWTLHSLVTWVQQVQISQSPSMIKQTLNSKRFINNRLHKSYISHQYLLIHLLESSNNVFIVQVWPFIAVFFFC